MSASGYSILDSCSGSSSLMLNSDEETDGAGSPFVLLHSTAQADRGCALPCAVRVGGVSPVEWAATDENTQSSETSVTPLFDPDCQKADSILHSQWPLDEGNNAAMTRLPPGIALVAAASLVASTPLTAAATVSSRTSSQAPADGEMSAYIQGIMVEAPLPPLDDSTSTPAAVDAMASSAELHLSPAGRCTGGQEDISAVCGEPGGSRVGAGSEGGHSQGGSTVGPGGEEEMGDEFHGDEDSDSSAALGLLSSLDEATYRSIPPALVQLLQQLEEERDELAGRLLESDAELSTLRASYQHLSQSHASSRTWLNQLLTQQLDIHERRQRQRRRVGQQRSNSGASNLATTTAAATATISPSNNRGVPGAAAAAAAADTAATVSGDVSPGALIPVRDVVEEVDEVEGLLGDTTAEMDLSDDEEFETEEGQEQEEGKGEDEEQVAVKLGRRGGSGDGQAAALGVGSGSIARGEGDDGGMAAAVCAVAHEELQLRVVPVPAVGSSSAPVTHVTPIVGGVDLVGSDGGASNAAAFPSETLEEAVVAAAGVTAGVTAGGEATGGAHTASGVVGAPGSGVSGVDVIATLQRDTAAVGGRGRGGESREGESSNGCSSKIDGGSSSSVLPPSACSDCTAGRGVSGGADEGVSSASTPVDSLVAQVVVGQRLSETTEDEPPPPEGISARPVVAALRSACGARVRLLAAVPEEREDEGQEEGQEGGDRPGLLRRRKKAQAWGVTTESGRAPSRGASARQSALAASASSPIPILALFLALLSIVLMLTVVAAVLHNMRVARAVRNTAGSHAPVNSPLPADSSVSTQQPTTSVSAIATLAATTTTTGGVEMAAAGATERAPPTGSGGGDRGFGPGEHPEGSLTSQLSSSIHLSASDHNAEGNSDPADADWAFGFGTVSFIYQHQDVGPWSQLSIDSGMGLDFTTGRVDVQQQQQQQQQQPPPPDRNFVTSAADVYGTLAAVAATAAGGSGVSSSVESVACQDGACGSISSTGEVAALGVSVAASVVKALKGGPQMPYSEEAVVVQTTMEAVVSGAEVAVMTRAGAPGGGVRDVSAAHLESESAGGYASGPTAEGPMATVAVATAASSFPSVTTSASSSASVTTSSSVTTTTSSSTSAFTPTVTSAAPGDGSAMAGDGTAGDGRGRSDSSALPVAPHAPRPPPSSGLSPPPPARIVLEAQAVGREHSACSALRRLAEDLCYQASGAGGEKGVQRKQSRGRTADSSRSRSGGGGSSPSATCQATVAARSLVPGSVHPAADAVRSAMVSLEERWRQLVRELKGVAEAAAPPPPPPPSPTRDRRSRQQPTHKSNRDPDLEERDILETRTRDQAAASQVVAMWARSKWLPRMKSPLREVTGDEQLPEALKAAHKVVVLASRACSGTGHGPSYNLSEPLQQRLDEALADMAAVAAVHVDSSYIGGAAALESTLSEAGRCLDSLAARAEDAASELQCRQRCTLRSRLLAALRTLGVPTSFLERTWEGLDLDLNLNFGGTDLDIDLEALLRGKSALSEWLRSAAVAAEATYDNAWEPLWQAARGGAAKAAAMSSRAARVAAGAAEAAAAAAAAAAEAVRSGHQWADLARVGQQLGNDVRRMAAAAATEATAAMWGAYSASAPPSAASLSSPLHSASSASYSSPLQNLLAGLRTAYKEQWSVMGCGCNGNSSSSNSSSSNSNSSSPNGSSGNSTIGRTAKNKQCTADFDALLRGAKEAAEAAYDRDGDDHDHDDDDPWGSGRRDQRRHDGDCQRHGRKGSRVGKTCDENNSDKARRRASAVNEGGTGSSRRRHRRKSDNAVLEALPSAVQRFRADVEELRRSASAVRDVCQGALEGLNLYRRKMQ